MQKERYTPIYNSSVGIVANKIISVSEFNKLWEETFEKNVSGIK